MHFHILSVDSFSLSIWTPAVQMGDEAIKMYMFMTSPCSMHFAMFTDTSSSIHHQYRRSKHCYVGNSVARISNNFERCFQWWICQEKCNWLKLETWAFSLACDIICATHRSRKIKLSTLRTTKTTNVVEPKWFYLPKSDINIFARRFFYISFPNVLKVNP